MSNEITNKEYEEKRLQYQLNRAKEYIKNHVSQGGAEPPLEWCIIKDLIRIIEKN